MGRSSSFSFLDELTTMIAVFRQRRQGLVDELNRLERELAALLLVEAIYKEGATDVMKEALH